MKTISWSSLQTILTLIYPHTDFTSLSIVLHFIQSLLHAVSTSSTYHSSLQSISATTNYSPLNEMCVGLCTASCMKELVEEAVNMPSETILRALHEYISIFLLFNTICMSTVTLLNRRIVKLLKNVLYTYSSTCWYFYIITCRYSRLPIPVHLV